MINQKDLLRNATSEELQHELQKRLETDHKVALHLLYNDEERVARSPGSDFDHDTPVEIGCAAKLATAMLVTIAVHEQRLSWSDPVSRFFATERDSPVFDHLGKVAIHQLQNHTHGLDATHIPRIGRTDAGYLDCQQLLCSRNPIQILASPGELVYYSSIGPWLSAIILERIYGQPYPRILQEKLLAPLGIAFADGDEHRRPCPATGEGFLLSARALFALSRLLMRNSAVPALASHSFTELYGDLSVSLPPRPYLGERMCLGILDYGNGCIGQSGRNDFSSVTIRVVPREGTCLVVTAGQDLLANTITTGLFGPQLYDMRAHRPPRQLLPRDAKLVDIGKFCGIYRNSRYTLKISAGDSGDVTGEVFEVPSRATELPATPLLKRLLRPSAENCFLASQPEPYVLGQVNFSGVGPAGKFLVARTRAHVFVRAADWKVVASTCQQLEEGHYVDGQAS